MVEAAATEITIMPFESAATYISVAILSNCATLMAIDRHLKHSRNLTFNTAINLQGGISSFHFFSILHEHPTGSDAAKAPTVQESASKSPFPSASIKLPPFVLTNGSLCSPTYRGRSNNASAHGHQPVPHLSLEGKQSQHQVCKSKVACAV